MPTRLLSSRQWNNLCRSSLVGAARKAECSVGSAGAFLTSTTTSSVPSHPRINYPPSTARRRRGEDAPDRRLAIGRLPRTLSTTPWYAPKDSNISLSQQPQPQEPQQPQQPQQPPSPSSTPQGRLRDGNQNGSQRNRIASYPVLAARSAHLEDVALGRVPDDTVRLEDYVEALDAWRELARETTRKRADNPGHKRRSSPPPPPEEEEGLEMARRARSLLWALEHNSLDYPDKATSAAFRLTTSLYNVVLQAYDVCDGGAVAALEAHELLEHMLTNVRATRQKPSPRWRTQYPEPSIDSYNIVLNGWARAQYEDAGIRAEGVVSRMDEWRRDCQAALQRDPSFPYHGCYPTAATVGSLIRALTGSRGVHGHERAMQLLQEVVEAQQNPTTAHHRFRNVRLDPRLFNAVILSCVRGGRGRDAALRAEEILSIAEKCYDEGLTKKLPCKRTNALVLDAWAKCEDSTGYCAQRAHDILFNMIRLYQQGVPIEFNAVAFGTCIAAWSRCANLSDAPEKAEAILQELLSLHEETGLVDFEPGVVLWETMQTVWLKATERTESMDRCAEVIQRMQKHGCQPASLSYAKVLGAAGIRGLGDRALALLQQYALHSNVPVLRDVRCLNGVLDALTREARNNSMDRATAFFEKMKSRDLYANPDVQSYIHLLSALPKDGRQAERGRDLLEEMMQRFQKGDDPCRPNTKVVSVVLKLCANTSGTDDDRRRALDIALEIFRTCESYYGVPPNHFVYNAMLHAINRFADSKGQTSERLELLEKVFEECEAGGHVSVATLTIMRQGGVSHCLSRLTAFSSRRVQHHHRPDTRHVLRKGKPGLNDSF